MGSSLQQVSNIKVMIRAVENLADKSIGTTINKFSSIFLHQRKSRKNHALSDKEQCNLVLFFKNEAKKEHTFGQIKQRDLAISSKPQSVYHSRISAFSTRYSRRQVTKEKPTIFRISSLSQDFSNVFSTTYLFASCLCHEVP